MDQLLAYANSVQLTNVFDAVGFTIFFYDYLITFPMEVQYVWNAPWNAGKLLFYFVRYLPFTDLPPVFYHQFSPYITPEGCEIVYDWTSWSFAIGICTSDAILAFRTWAIWDKSKRCAILLAVVFTCCWVPSFISVGLFAASLEFQSQNAAVEGCLPLRASDILSVVWALVMAYQFVIFSATLIRGIELYRQVSGLSRLMKTLYWDALMFSTCLFVVAIANMVVVLTAPTGYANLLSSFQRAMHALLVARILLHLRQESAGNPSEQLETTVVDIRPPEAQIGWASRPTGADLPGGVRVEHDIQYFVSEDDLNYQQ